MVNLSKARFTEEIERLTIFYPNWSIKVNDPKVMKTWYNFMIVNNVTDDLLISAVIKHIKEIKFNPTMATLIECGIKNYEVGALKTEDVPDWVKNKLEGE